MDYLRGLKSVLSNPQPENQPSPADTVERLVDRVESSSLLEDRRDACRGLKGLSKKYRIEVGAQGLETLIKVLDSVQDVETISIVLETLCNVTSTDIFDEEVTNSCPVGEQFTEIFLKKPENVSSVISQLDEYAFSVRLPAIRLLSNLLLNKPKDMQEIVLVSPMGVSKLMDILSDDREFVRNEALLLLTQLTKSNANIQKIVAFENGFDRIFQVIRDEGYSEGGIVVYDCLHLMLNLLKNNLSNQTFFREGSYTKFITPFFQNCLQKDDENPSSVISWSGQKISNVHSMIQVVRTLVSPSNASQVVGPVQKAMATCGLLAELCRFMLVTDVPEEILSNIICTVAEMIRGCQANQEFFMKIMASPSRSALVVLVMSMVNDKNPLSLRTAVLYFLQCYLYKNEIGQTQIVQALLPTSADALATITPGQLLCMGLFTTDALSHWLSAVSLSHALVNNVNNKELLLRVHLATSPGAQPVSLLQQSFSILQVGKVQSRLGILILLSTWLANCANAVTQFLRLADSVAFLISQVASNEHDELEIIVQSLCSFLLGLCVLFNNDSNTNFTKDSLCQIITKRIGVDTFLDKLAEVSKHEVYSKGLKHPQVHIASSGEVQLDHEFCRLYKTLESQLVKAIAPTVGGGAKVESPSESELKAVAKYKEVIRDQDDQIQHLRQRLAALDSQYIAAQSQIDELNATIQQLQDQNALLKAQRNNNVSIDEPPAEASFSSSQVQKLEQELESLRLDNERLRTQVQDQERNIHSLNGDGQNPDLVRSLTNTCSSSIMESFQITPAKHEEFQMFSMFRTEPNPQQATLEAELGSLRQELQRLRDGREAESTSLTHQLNSLRQQNDNLSAELDKSKKDQEDLLILLADQDGKIQKYKDLLKRHGETVSEDEDIDDDDDVDLEDENGELSL